MKSNDVLFHKNNHDIKFKLPPLISGTLEEQVDWILSSADIGWIELDINIDINKWQEEAQHATDYYQEYRDDDSKGWSSCCLHGLATDAPYTADNYGYNELTAPYKYTELSTKCPTITKFWKSIFPHNAYTRIRFMKLNAGGYISVHNDGSAKRPIAGILPINIAIIHPEDNEMVIEGKGVVPWKEGKVMLINISKNHAVFNMSKFTRVHMIANLVVENNTEFYNLIVRSYNKQYVNNN